MIFCRIVFRIFLGSLLALSIVLLAGCGGGGQAKTPNTSINGHVVAADNGNPLGGATVQLVAVQRARGELASTVTTADGRFSLDYYSAADGEVRLLVTPLAASGFAPFEMTMTMASGAELSEIYLRPVPNALADRIGSITLTPPNATLLTGQTQQFTAVVKDVEGNPLALTPTWIISSDFRPAIGTLGNTGLFTARRAGSGYVYAHCGGERDEAAVTVTSPAGTKLFFLHHSVGAGIIGGGVREAVAVYNNTHGTNYRFWDHGYNGDGLTDADGNATGLNYAIPDDNTDTVGLYNLWTSSTADCVAARTLILNNYKVIAFKSCFPNSDIPDNATLEQYKTWYLAMRNVFDAHPDRLFIVMSPPPLHRLATNSTAAANARAFANWLSSAAYLSGHANLRCFNLFNNLAKANDGSATANMLRYAYEGSHSSDDSHPNALGNETVAPIFANFLCENAQAWGEN